MTRVSEDPRDQPPTGGAGVDGSPVPPADVAAGRPASSSGAAAASVDSARPLSTARDRAKADRRAALLAAAARLFAERGFDGVTLGDIGEAAGVSGPAVYRHVAGKQALLGAILVDVSERLLEGGRRVAHSSPASTTAEIAPDTPPSAAPAPRVAKSPRRCAHPASAPQGPDDTDAVLGALVDFHVTFALAEADVIRVQDRDLDRLSPADRRTVRSLQNAYVAVWTEALAAANPDAETPAERRVRALACFGLINSTPHSVRGVPAARVRPALTRMALAALTA
ncbi:TetR/AcrR family transcriptional regulator [uncultured Microbacterium sp.]|uniref:TetR/AcrR family transcriptional regulator n=1 Tax=uncultured Microbacterium sp. TaxID=191216 RepID=UPI0025DBC8A6|nr:TetR/AcrR family transcriptional regulator [uncultured Microbacterium sp.]